MRTTILFFLLFAGTAIGTAQETSPAEFHYRSLSPTQSQADVQQRARNRILVNETLGERPSFPIGTLDPGAIPKVLRETPPLMNVSLSEQGKADIREAKNGDHQAANPNHIRSGDWGNTGLLLYATVITGLLVYALSVAFDYRQRWVQALTTQNSRLAQSFDAIAEGLGPDVYSSEIPFRPEETELLYGGVKFGNGLDN